MFSFIGSVWFSDKWSLRTWENYLYKKRSLSDDSTKWCAQPRSCIEPTSQKSMEKHDVQGWKALLWGVPLSATKNASDWQRSSKRLITLGLLIFLPFLMISRDRFWIFLARSQKLLLSTLVRAMLCNSFIYIYIFNYIYISYSYVFLGTLYIPNLPIPQTQNQDTRAAPAWGTVWSSAGFSEAGCQT